MNCGAFATRTTGRSREQNTGLAGAVKRAQSYCTAVVRPPLGSRPESAGFQSRTRTSVGGQSGLGRPGHRQARCCQFRRTGSNEPARAERGPLHLARALVRAAGRSYPFVPPPRRSRCEQHEAGLTSPGLPLESRRTLNAPAVFGPRHRSRTRPGQGTEQHPGRRRPRSFRVRHAPFLADGGQWTGLSPFDYATDEQGIPPRTVEGPEVDRECGRCAAADEVREDCTPRRAT
jgi:hypothetical protein